MLDKPLDGAHTHCCRYERACHKLAVYLRSVQSWEFRLQTIDLIHCGIWEGACPAAVRAFFWQECIDPSFAVEGFPLGQRPRFIVHCAAARECERLLCNTLIISVP